MTQTKPHPQEKYLNLKTKQHEYFVFQGNHIYKRVSDGKEFKVMELRAQYRFISTYKGTIHHGDWEHNPVNGFKMRPEFTKSNQ